MRFIGVLTWLLVVPPVGAAEPESGALVPNPGFELIDGNLPAFWAKRTPDDGVRKLSHDGQVAHGGERSVCIENTATTESRWRTGHLGDFRLQPGTEARLSGWIKTRDLDGAAFLRFYCMDRRGSILSQPNSNAVSGTSGWTQVRIEQTIPDGTAYCMLYLQCVGKGTAWFDDLELQGTAAPGEAHDTGLGVSWGPDGYDWLTGIEAITWTNGKPTLSLPEDRQRGKATRAFWGETAQYRATAFVVGGALRTMKIRLRGSAGEQAEFGAVSEKPDGQGLWRAISEPIDLQRFSEVVVEVERQKGGDFRLYRVDLRPVGRYAGELLPLKPPPTLLVYPDADSQASARAMLPALINKGQRDVAAKRDAELDALNTPDDWRVRQRRTRSQLHRYFGDWPEKTPLNPQIVGKLDRDGYIIEKLIFESRPRYYCTANVYVPKGRDFPVPGVLFTCGHSADGKGEKLYHECCLGLVLKGYLVVALDPTGQGERSEYVDPETKKHLVPLCVSQHHYLGRPSFLVGRSLAGYRTWDCIRAVDYLVSRPEVDADQLAVVGNSGGGQMALLAAAADERLDVCAAAHPGGSMENTYLAGQWLIDRQVLSLIPPRPCRMIVGNASGEEGGHRAKLNDMLRFYRGLGVAKDRGQLVLVDGVHNMKQPKRVAAYEWLNQWFAKEAEGSDEPELQAEDAKTLWCTESGFTVLSLGGETGQTLNAMAATDSYPRRKAPRDAAEWQALKARLATAVTHRIGLRLSTGRPTPTASDAGQYDGDGFTARKLVIEGEPGIRLPALLLTPTEGEPTATVVHLGETGKPQKAGAPSLAIEFARRGTRVLSVDVGGVGETDPSASPQPTSPARYQPDQWRRDSLAINAAYQRITMLAMRANDAMTAVDWAVAQPVSRESRLTVVGEGLGGLWALLAGAFHARVDAVTCIGTVPSYRLLVGAQCYNAFGYWWVPGALKDFDIPDLVALNAPKPVLMLDSVDAMGEPLPAAEAQERLVLPRRCFAACGDEAGLAVVATEGRTATEHAAEIASFTAAGR